MLFDLGPWTPERVKRFRGQRTLEELGSLLGVPKNTVWRWEAGYATPEPECAGRLSKLAEHERFLKDWKLVGSMELLGDIEAASEQISEAFGRAVARSARELSE